MIIRALIKFAFVLNFLFGMALAICRAQPYYIVFTNNSLGYTAGNNSYDGEAAVYNGTHGPWRDLSSISVGGHTLPAGSTTYVLGNFDASTASQNYINYLQASLSASSTSPIILTNYPGGTWSISNAPSTGDVAAIELTYQSQWVKIYGCNFSNDFYGVYATSVSNIEIGNCTFTNSPNIAVLLYSSSRCNWIHNCSFYNANPISISSCTDGGSDSVKFGAGYASDDFDYSNIVESCNFYYNTHAGVEMNSSYCVILNCYFFNPSWVLFSSCDGQQIGDTIFSSSVWAGGREISMGGYDEHNGLVQGCVCSTGGWTGDQPPELDIEGGATNIIRNCDAHAAAGVGMAAYAEATLNGGNIFFNDTVAFCGTNGTWYQNGTYVQVNYAEYQFPLMSAGSSNNAFVNCLLYDNYSSGTGVISTPGGGGFSGNISDWRGNMTNQNPLWVSLANSAGAFQPWPPIEPNLHLGAGSPAIGAGAWLTTISSSSGSGTSFTVASNASYFYQGCSAAGRTIPPDTICFLGHPAQQVALASVSGNTFTMSAPVAWTNGEWIAVTNIVNSQTGNIDAGAYSYLTNAIASSGLIITDGNGAIITRGTGAILTAP